MRCFILIRHDDPTGISGKGRVAEGIEFKDGHVAMRWTTNTPSTVIYDTIEHVQLIHGHGGKTDIVWVKE